MRLWEEKIMNLLLDKYEKRAPQSQRICRLNVKKEIPELLDAKGYVLPDTAIRALEAKGYIHVKRSKESGIPCTVLLAEDHAGAAYKELGRKPQTETDKEITELIKIYGNSCPTNHSFCRSLSEIIQQNRVSVYRKDPGRLATALEYISITENNRAEIYREEMSAMATGCTTHTFKEEYASFVYGIMKTFGNYPDAKDITDILRGNKIIPKERLVKIKGNGTVILNDGSFFRLSGFPHGLGISNNDVDQIKEIKADRLIVVENETAYESMQEDAVIILSSGFPGREETDLIKKVKAGSYYHTGDIDAGGFLIFRNICDNTSFPFQPYMMDTETYEKYLDAGIPLTGSDIKRLKRIKGFDDLIACMLEKGKKIEQEHIWKNIRRENLRAVNDHSKILAEDSRSFYP